MKNLGSSLLLALAITINVTYSQKPRLGGSVDVYHHYGHLEETIRVMPIDDDQPWFFREHSVNILRNPVPVPKVKQPQNSTGSVKSQVYMEFCDSIDKLPKAYFREFQFEGMKEPWRAFNANWSSDSIAKRFGFNATYTGSNYSYVLLKYEVFHDTDKLAASSDNVEATENVAKEIERIEKNSFSHLIDFFENFGSHYISAYTTGNALYQVSKVHYVGCSRCYNIEFLLAKIAPRKRETSSRTYFEKCHYFFEMSFIFLS